MAGTRDQGHVRSKGRRDRLRRASVGTTRGSRPRRGRDRVRRLLGRVLALASRSWARRRSALRLRCPRGPEGCDRRSAGLPLAALHGSLRARHAPALPTYPARHGLRGAAGGLQRRELRRGSRARGLVLERLRTSLPKVAELSRPTRRTCSPSTASRLSTGRSSARPTRSSASTARSAGGLTSSESFPTTPR